MISLINKDIFLSEIKILKFSKWLISAIYGIRFTIIFQIYPDSILTILSFKTKSIHIMPRSAYVLSQFLRLLPRYEFQSIVIKYKGGYHTN